MHQNRCMDGFVLDDKGKKIPTSQDLTGKVFGRWTVLGYSHTDRNGRAWNCQCNCIDKTIKTVNTGSLKIGNSKSCGCLQKEDAKNRVKQMNLTNAERHSKKKREQTCSICGIAETETPYFCYDGEYGRNLCNKHYVQLQKYGKILDFTQFDGNEINIKENYAEVVLRNSCGEEVGVSIIDKDDIDLISRYKWHLTATGYVGCKNNNESFTMHRLIKGDRKDFVLDHIDGNRFDNRKSNLRYVTLSQNATNKTIQSNNKTNIQGVSWLKNRQNWRALIQKDDIKYRKTTYDIFDAMMYRFIQEINLFGKHRRFDNWKDLHKVPFIVCIINKSNIADELVSNYIIDNSDMKVLNYITSLVIEDDCVLFIDEDELSVLYSEFGYRIISVYIEPTSENHTRRNKIKKASNLVLSIGSEKDINDIFSFIDDRKKDISVFSDLRDVASIEELQHYSSFSRKIREWKIIN